MIYHLVLHSDLRRNVQGAFYRADSLVTEGFIHCSLEAAVIPVANDYFSQAAEPLLLLTINPEQLGAEVKYEAAKVQAGVKTDHVSSAPLFPHVYGPMDLAAITGVGTLARTPTGYGWPQQFTPLAAWLNA